MIELIFKDLLDGLGYNAYSVKLPEKAKFPAITYQVSGYSNQKLLEASIKSRTSNFKVEVFAANYGSAKQVQQKIEDLFEDLSGTYTTESGKEYSILGEIQDIKDLFELSLNKIIIDISLNYYIN